MTAEATTAEGANRNDSGSGTAAPQITSRPLIAVVGVLLGALASVFTGRLLSVGLSDLQGAIAANSDDLSWVVTSYNAANMLIGPLIVFIGGLLGPRRILLWASAVFMTAEFLSPLVAHNIGALAILQFIAGLSAGTYYPLTITVIVRNLPMRWVQFGVAAYALDILASTHIATALQSWYQLHLGWQWIFWNALFVTPMLMVCIYFGIPPQPVPKAKPGTSFWGFLYAGLGLTLIYVGLDQGERLDWLHSSTVSAFLITGVFLIAVALYQRFTKPNPLLNIRFLASRNFLLLGAVLVLFRLLLLAPTLLLPQFLAVLHGYRADQTGQVLGWISVMELIAAPIAGWLLYRIDSRLLCAIGFAVAAITCVFNSRIDPGWTGETFVASQVLNAIGIAFALTGLVTTIMRHAIATGALKNPANILSLACWFQTCRLFGAEIGKTSLLHFLKVQATFHYTDLAPHLDGGWLTDERLRSLATELVSGGSGVIDASVLALLQISSQLKEQIVILSLRDAFILIAYTAAACLVLLGFVTYAPPLVPSEKKSAA